MKRNRLAALILVLALLSGCGPVGPVETVETDPVGEERVAAFREKAEALHSAALEDWVREELGESPAGGAGHAVFFSVCDGVRRASVFHGAGETPDAAWSAAAAAVEGALQKEGAPDPVWVKVDLVYLSESIPADWLGQIGETFGSGNFRYGLALDPGYQTAFLEAELNSAGIYDYQHGGLDLERLNSYLAQNGREALESLPDQYTAFQCAGWFCDESGNVCQLILDEPGYGRRELPAVDGSTAQALMLDGAEYLAGLVGEDGTIPDANGEPLDAAGRAEVLSALVSGYELNSSQAIAGSIDRAAGKLLAEIAYTDNGPAFLPDGGEITLESCSLSLIALADCMEASGNAAYLPACEALGAGILSLLDTETGAFFQVLDAASLERKEAFRSAAWDGMGVTALCRLYALTEDSLWLWAARQALDHMVKENYAQYGEAWTSYAAREFTKHEQTQADYYVFALSNAQQNLSAIYGAQDTFPAGLELLMASYEAYRQMAGVGYSADGFELELMLQVIYSRAVRQVDGYLFPEYAMYMDSPQQALGAFMTREEGLGVSPRAVCRNIRGYHMYATDYDTLVADGMPVTG